MAHPRRMQTRSQWARGTQSLLSNTPDGWTSSAGGWGAGADYTGPRIFMGADDPYGFATPGYGEKIAAVGRATGLIADTLAGVPWHTYRGDERTDTIPTWISDPMGAQSTADNRRHTLTAVQFWSQIIVDMLHHGEAFILHGLDYDKQPTDLIPVPPAAVEAVSNDRGVWIAGENHPPDRVMHLRGRAPYRISEPPAGQTGWRGVGVLTRHAETLGLAANVDAYASNTFRSGVPTGYLKASQPGLSTADAERLAATWMEKHGSRRQVAVLNNSVEFVPATMSPLDAELLGMQAFTLREIAHAFGMSAHYLDVQGSSDTYANVRDRQLDFRQLTLLPWTRLIESELDTILPRGTTLKLRLDGLERGTTGQRFDDYTKALAGGWLTIDEIRALENMPPLEGNT